MPNLSVKNVPEDILISLRAQANRNHRSLQGELIEILEDAVRPKKLTAVDVHRMVVESGVKTEGDSVRMIREDRDAR